MKVKNSFSNQIENFPDSELLTVYICGPTVYNTSHLGHARTYLTFDIIRRILEQVFGRTVVYQMNITDIDDKIITRSNELQISALELARKYEALFLKDLEALNIQQPTAITRVTECIPEIVAFVQQIMDNGYAYASNGSVYFDTAAFSQKFQYPKLRYLTTESQQELLTQAEGVSMKNRTDEKKCPSDFALWKAAKPSEPAWPSPWGEGRPGWHIECSVMSDLFLLKKFNSFDLHLGGKDLQFPHHANEVAQLEAYYQKSDLIKYFMHSGHLRIDNEIMSKSKMNFKTIQDVLQQFTPNQLRILFLQVDYASDINYSATQLENAVLLDKKICAFLANAAVGEVTQPPYLAPEDVAVLQQITETQLGMKRCYAADFDYPGAFKLLLAFVESVKQYQNQNKEAKGYVVKQAAAFVQKQLEILGLVFAKAKEGQTRQLAELISQFRLQVKQAATAPREGDADAKQKAQKLELLRICDQLRDEQLVQFGYLIEDHGADAVVKEVNYEEFLKNKQREELLKQEKLEKVRLQNAEKQRKLDEEKEIAKIPAEKMFQTAEFTAWDEKGIPTKQIVEGVEEEVPKSKVKKMQKEWEQRKKLNEKYK